MALYYCEVTYTGQKNRVRPETESFCVRAPTIDACAKIVVKAAIKKWPWFRFETILLDRSRILK